METDQNCAVGQQGTQQQTLPADQNDGGSSEEPFDLGQPSSPTPSVEVYDSDDTDSSTSYDSDFGSVTDDDQEDRLPSLVTDLARLFDRFRCGSADDAAPCAMAHQLQRVLAQWAKDENVADDALTILLEILRENHCTHLPADAQTLHYIVENVDENVTQNESEE